MPLLIASTHTITDGALARLPAAEMMLAVYAVVKALTNAVKAPELVALQLMLALVEDRGSLRRVGLFLTLLCALLTAVLALLGFTPLGEVVLRDIVGLRDPVQLAAAQAALPILLLLPLAETLRNGLQGIAIGLKRTAIMPLSTLLRILALLLFFGWAVSTQRLSGVTAATLSWLLGIGLEALMIFLYLRHRYGSLGRAADQMPERGKGRLGMVQIARFFAPLAVMVALSAWLQPLVQGGLARGSAPTASLAAFGVAWGLTYLIIGPVTMLHQCTLLYTDGREDPNWRRVMRFCLGVGAVAGGAVLLVALTAPGHDLLRRAIGVPEPVVRLVLPTMVAFASWPVVRAWREAYWGLLMRERRTSIIGVAKVANLVAVALALLLALGPLRLSVVVPPPAVGALAYAFGELVESLVIWRYATGRASAPRPAIISP